MIDRIVRGDGGCGNGLQERDPEAMDHVLWFVWGLERRIAEELVLAAGLGGL
jgi:hypothetical protein